MQGLKSIEIGSRGELKFDTFLSLFFDNFYYDICRYFSAAMFSISQPVYFFFVVSYSSRRDPSQPSLVTRELEKAFADRDIHRRKNLPPVDPRGHTGVAAGATRAGAARDRRR